MNHLKMKFYKRVNNIKELKNFLRAFETPLLN